VNVRNVLSSSAAERAGIEPGDQIVAYSGQRIFEVGELNQVLLQGEAGETVLVDIIRDGQPMQVAIERGPLGISSGFGGRGNRPLR
jgi:S1-C subfamily serine protease